MALDTKYGTVLVSQDSQRNPLNASEDEMVLVLRPSDAYTLAAIRALREEATEDGNDSYADAMLRLYEVWEEWQENNPERVKPGD